MSDEIKLWCWVQGDEVYRVFDIQIKLSDTISTLKRLIRVKKPSFQHIAADILEPWKVGELCQCTLVRRSDFLLV
jgi:Crinkler effector protein N-terminal domain